MYGTVAYVLGALVALYLSINNLLRRSYRNYPPGPRSHWLKGYRLPESYAWLTYQEWSKTYGDVIYVRVFGNPVLILNSVEAAHELLGRRSKIYSSRPVKTMLVELMGLNWSFVAMPYGKTWKRHRSMFNHHIHPGSEVYRPTQLKETHRMLNGLLKTPKKFDEHIRRSQSSILLSISYGGKNSSDWDDVVRLSEETSKGLQAAAVYGTYLVDYLPILRYVPSWLPGASFKNKARYVQLLNNELLNSPFQNVKRKMADGTAVPCIVTRELENLSRSESSAEDESLIKGVAAIAFSAGIETTNTVIRTLIFAMLSYPETQKKAQAELDLVIGPGRLPTFGDKTDLPYIGWIVWECLRWRPPVPTGVAHSNTEDDEYRGFFIPKGTNVIPNVWAMFHDERNYPKPESFAPERFEGVTEEITGLNDLPMPAFGFGRRICPGWWFAYESVWIAAANILHAFVITDAVDSEGCPIKPNPSFTSGQMSMPLPFECSITPRFEGVEQMLGHLDD